MLSSTYVTSVDATGMGVTGGTGELNAAHTVTLTVNFNDFVTVDTTNGSPTLKLNSGGPIISEDPAALG